MIYGYIRVSTDKQTVENQRFEITAFAKARGLVISEWIEETISGTKDPSKRKLGVLLGRLSPGDVLLCSELSRLGRSLFMIISVLNFCLNAGIKVWTIKDNFRLEDDISSKVIAFAFGFSAEIERNLISQRTKEALARLKAEGVRIGRTPFLAGREDELRELHGKYTQAEIGKMLGVSQPTVSRYYRVYLGISDRPRKRAKT